jgi:hypothetical protein
MPLLRAGAPETSMPLRGRGPAALDGRPPASGAVLPLRTVSLAAVLSLALLSVLSAGCTSKSGTLAVQATDAPDDIGDFSSLTVHVDRISVHGEGISNKSYTPSSPTFDLAQLHDGNLTTLFNGSVAAGTYTYLEMHIQSASGVLKSDNSTVQVTAPSSRIFLNTHFTVQDGQQTTFVFDVQVHQVGNGDYQLKPNAAGSHANR